jgi:hypothetical protein
MEKQQPDPVLLQLASRAGVLATASWLVLRDPGCMCLFPDRASFLET